MVTVDKGNVEIRGTANDITTDILCLMNAYTDLKDRNILHYVIITENIKYLIENDETTLPCIKEFLQTLGDLL